MAIEAADFVRRWQAGSGLLGESLDVVTDLNLQCIDLLAAMATTDARHGPAMLATQAALWAALPDRARQRLADSPCLLVDAGFDDLSRWRSLEQCMVQDLPAQYAQPAFAGDGVGSFISQVLMLGWHLARSNPQLARIVLGMSAACAERIGQLRLQDLYWLALHRPGWVRPRWERQPQVWRQLLLAARSPAASPLTRVGLRSLQLMAAGALASTGAVAGRQRR